MRVLSVFVGVLVGAFLLVTFTPTANDVEAGTAIRMDVAELAERADLVIEARVLSMLALEEPDGRIETEFLLQVQRTFVGDDLAHRTVRLPGGILPNGRGMLLAGMPSVEVGEHAILFLTGPTASGMRMPVGLAQGKMRVLTLATGEKLVVAEQAGLELADPDSGKVVEADGALVLPYAQALAQIEAACGGALDNDVEAADDLPVDDTDAAASELDGGGR